ncbi:hypothetical protein PV408_45475 [Streptomyces sp. ME18-1-4]|nr:hypothetical protein [Streptomyces sp. ME18-1-4]MDX3248805.1 hypothetical protein [Streptomyces sp. ME18-1-4]
MRERAGREAAGEQLTAQEVGELTGLVRTQPTTRAVGGDGGRALPGVVTDAVVGAMFRTMASR